jgi:copper(I)-binding protein
MKRLLNRLCVAVWAFVAVHASAEVTVTEAWVRGTHANETATAVYMKLRSSEDLSLINAASPAAGIVEIHEMIMSGNARVMRSIDDVPLPAGRTVELKPGGFHVMLIELWKPLVKGERVPIVLTFADNAGKRSKLEFKAEVRAAALPSR